ncbi:COX assembly mitochondrial protein like protein [Habropoda laboriosa]|uniref:COX assembly mitochondrial protein n=1 Tax=Habropoda laboriosa TaxID=597456 RepID=A0A0L7QLA0_9HYME|nr:PREDICTED: COX assembly mitochondrial protein homolog [Habropoda laboriosa]XP_017796369.1 PREDICTED: COX assembly mitochondrial protein homolog [Habropoda laboriosa]KOC59397.1 COX assembly mitochondrial protein like protein [Habropoda laboriosa]
MKDIPSSNISYKSFGGGPHNLGNPDDKSLRKVEKEILIPQKMRDRAKEEKCVEEVKNFTECCKDSSIVMPFKCRNQNTALKDCLALWYNDPKFKEECTLDYLEERSEYRRTGIPKRSKAARMASS